MWRHLIGLAVLLSAGQSVFPQDFARPEEDPYEQVRKRVHGLHFSHVSHKESAKAIGAYAYGLRSAVLALGGCLKHDPDPEARAAAAEALGNIGPTAYQALPALIEGLKDPEDAVRREAANALGMVGLYAAPAVPALTAALKDKDARVRQRVAAALGQVGPVDKGALLALIEALNDPDPGIPPKEVGVAQKAAEALGMLGPQAREAVPALLKQLDGKGAQARSVMLMALGKISKGDKALVPLLVKNLKDQEGCAAAATALAYIGPAAQEAVPDLLAALGRPPLQNADDVRRFKVKVMGALERIGPPATEALPALRVLEKDADAIIALHAKRAREKIEGGQ